jgi:hypothetical protein
MTTQSNTNASGASCSMVASGAEGSLSKQDVGYPRDVFDALIDGNSPYAFYLFQWVPYQTDAKRWRLKMKHDVRTFDGREAFGIWPNGDSCGPFNDSEVEFIRISRKQWGEEWADPRPSAGAAVQDATQMQRQDHPEPRQQEPNQSTEANKGEQS